VNLLTTAGAALSDARFSTSQKTDGTTSIMIDLSSAFAEFEFKLKITTMGMVTAEIPVKAFVYASGTSCTYTGTPATQNQAIAYPVTSAPSFDLTSLVTYGSNAQGDTACPIKQILWYYDTGSGVAFQEANPTSK
jgi:hypothetical protein